jgi:predicted amidohydrolase
MKTKFAITALQLDLDNYTNNLTNILAQMRLACAIYPFTRMLVIGELATFGTDQKNAALFDDAVQAYCDLAKELGVWIVPGSMFEPSDDPSLVYNTAPIINDKGEVVNRYRKIFPWLPFESGTKPGTEFVVFDVPDAGRIGVSICYDHMFPETSRALAWMGAEVILHPTATYSPDRPMELTVAKANAATNQCYFFDINNGGTLSLGQSIIAGPEGEEIYQSPGVERSYIPIAVDFEHVREIRRNGSCHVSQMLKSLRDSDVTYPQYGDNRLSNSETLNALGELKLPNK